MRIVSWNCNMALHRKLPDLLGLEPDVAIIPECADFNGKASEYGANSSVWIGDSQHKGLGVLSFGSFEASLSPVYRPNCFPYIAPVQISGPTCFNLLAVWACHKKKNSYKERLGPLRRAIRTYQTFIGSSPTIVAGDFNDNVKWDRPKKPNKHATNVAELAG
jgi:endonuclease/exonuclease/phosphatase family metal-dependent hydrolase